MSASKKLVIRYDDKTKEFPCDQLYNLFKLAGWTDGSETDDMLKNFNVPFINSTLVVSTWDNELTFLPFADTEFRYIIKLRRCPQWEGENIQKNLNGKL